MKYDLEEIWSRIESGDSQAEIAKDLGITHGRLSQILNKDEETANRSARAREMSAEAWLDRGLRTLEEAPADSNEIARARAIAQECARRAAIRNPRYSEKRVHEVSGPNGGPIKTEEVTRPKITKEEWLAAHGLGTAARPAE